MVIYLTGFVSVGLKFFSSMQKTTIIRTYGLCSTIKIGRAMNTIGKKNMQFESIGHCDKVDGENADSRSFAFGETYTTMSGDTPV